MGRGYTRRFLESLYEKIKEEIPDLLLGSDIIVGFPGEDPSAFNDTLTLVERYIDHLHPFPYSDRPGVRSSGMKPKVPQEVIHRRMEVIRKLGEKKKRDFARSLLGRSAEVLVETTQENGRFFGYTEHYVGVFVEGGRPGTLLPVILQEKNGEIIGVPISSEEGGKVLCG
jgi:tRNA A37 methylthiotransferase MiaB